MSASYYIVLDSTENQIDTFVSGKYVAQAASTLKAFCEAQGLSTIEDFYWQDGGEFLDDIDLPESQPAWFEAEDGIKWISGLILKIEQLTPKFDASKVIPELEEYKNVLNGAHSLGAKWRFELDI